MTEETEQFPAGLKDVLKKISGDHTVESWRLKSHTDRDAVSILLNFRKKNEPFSETPNHVPTTSNVNQEENFTVKHFGVDIFNRYQHYRDQGLFTDLTLVVEDKSFEVHRIVLAGCSDYFQAMFSHDMIESKSKSITLSEIPVLGFEPLLDYAYSGTLRVNLNTVGDVLSAATFLQFVGAIPLCENYMKKNLSFATCDGLVELANRFSLVNVSEEHKRFVLNNFHEFTKTDAFLKLDWKTLTSYLMDDSLHISSEKELFKAALGWYNYDKEGRECTVHYIMDAIRFVQEGWPLIEYAAKREPFVSNKNCRELVKFWIAYMKHATRKYLVTSHRSRVRYDRKTLVVIGGIKTEPMDQFSLYAPSMACANEKHKYYDRNTKLWHPLGVLSVGYPVSNGVLLEVNDFGILIGGRTCESEYDFPESMATNTVKVLIPTAPYFAMWDLPCMLEARTDHTAVHIPGYIYAVGGFNEASGQLSSIEQYNMDKEKWTFAKKMDTSLQDHASSAYKHLIFSSGGMEGTQVTNRVKCYNHKNNTWTEKPPLHTARHRHTMDVLATSLIVCGGAGRVPIDGPSDIRPLSSVESFCLETEQWTYVTPMRFEACGATSLVLEDLLLVCGGNSATSELWSHIQQFDPKTENWTIFGQLPYPVIVAGICALTIKISKEINEEADKMQYGHVDRWSLSDLDDDSDSGSFL